MSLSPAIQELIEASNRRWGPINEAIFRSELCREEIVQLRANLKVARLEAKLLAKRKVLAHLQDRLRILDNERKEAA